MCGMNFSEEKNSGYKVFTSVSVVRGGGGEAEKQQQKRTRLMSSKLSSSNHRKMCIWNYCVQINAFKHIRTFDCQKFNTDPSRIFRSPVRLSLHAVGMNNFLSYFEFHLLILWSTFLSIELNECDDAFVSISFHCSFSLHRSRSHSEQ